MKKMQKGISWQSFLRLRKLASGLNLSFSKYFSFGKKVIGLDRSKKQLLISEGPGDQDPTRIIELDKIKSISLKKSYGSIKAGELNKSAIHQFLKSIRLQFEYKDNNKAVFSLYDGEDDEKRELFRMDSGSKNLHYVLTQIVGGTKGMISSTV